MTDNEKKVETMGSSLRKALDEVDDADLEKFSSRSQDVPHELSNITRTQTPITTIELALKHGSDLTQLEKLMELQERYEANEAKKAFHVAMAEFKKNPPEILKDRKVSFGEGKTSYHHATLANVCEKVIQGLSEHGLSHGWKTDQSQENKITVECVITHAQGHSESTKLSAKPDETGSKNPIQAMGSTITYLERYTLLALTGLATHDQDNNGKGAEVEHVNEKQLSTITDMINNLNADESKFCEVMGVESLDKIPASDFNKAMKKLKDKEKKLKEH